MPLCSEFEDCSSKQVELDGHLGGHGGVNDGSKLMGSEDPQRVVPEVKNRDELKRFGIWKRLRSSVEWN